MYKQLFSGLVLSGALAGAGAGAVCAQDWPQWRGPERNGLATNSPALADAFPQGGPVKLWTSERIPGDKKGGYGSVAVADGRAYVLVHEVYRESVPERRVSRSRLARQGYRPDMPAEYSALVEAARVSPERLNVKQYNAARKWATEWIRANAKEAWKRFQQPAMDRLVAGANALSLDVLAKLESVKQKTFADQTELDAWFVAQGIDENTRKNIQGRRRLIDTATPKGRDSLYCLDAESGKTVWKTNLPGAYLDWPDSSTPTVSGGRVYVLNSESTVCCLAVGNGELLWKSELLGRAGHRHNRSSSALVIDGTVVVSTEANLVALAVDTGKVLWRQKRVKSESASPVAWKSDGKTCVLSSGSGKVTCVDLKTGEPSWSVPSRAESTPAVVGDYMAYVGGDNRSGQSVYRLTTGQPEQLWSVPIKDHYASPVIYAGHVYVIGEKGRALCIELASGKIAWEERITSGVAELSSPVIADGKLIIVAGPWLYLIKATPEKFTLLGKADVDAVKWTSPAVADGKVFLRTKDGVVCYDLRKQ